MPLTKAQTDEAFLNSVSINNKNAELGVNIYVRNTDSTHPQDCKCLVCLKINKRNEVQEPIIKRDLNYYIGDSKG